MKKLLQVLCLVLGAWMVCSNGWAQTMGKQFEVNMTLVDWNAALFPQNAVLSVAKSVKITVTKCNYVKLLDGSGQMVERAWDSDKTDAVFNLSGNDLTVAKNGRLYIHVGGRSADSKVFITNYDTEDGASNDNSSTSGGGTTGGAFTGDKKGGYTAEELKAQYNPIDMEKVALIISKKRQITHLPTVYINVPDIVNATSQTDINAVLNKDGNTADYHKASIKVVDDNDETLEFEEDKLDIKVRGNETAKGSKKPYRLKFGKDKKDTAGNVIETHKHDMLGYGYAKRNWTLIANQKDGSMAHNALSYHIGKAVGMDFCPGYRFVDLVINDVYLGCYMISDHVEVGSNRIELEDESTGWYVETNRQDQVEEPYVEAGGLNISIKNPEPANDAETAALKAEVRDFFTKAKAIIDNSSNKSLFCDPVNGWRAYFDEEALVKYYVGTNLTGNHDGFMTVKMSRDVGKKMKVGPLWDHDTAFGIYDDGTTLSEDAQANAPLFCNYAKAIAENDPVFMKKAHDLLHKVMDNGYMTNIIKNVEDITASVRTSQIIEAPYGDAYKTEPDKLKTYINTHSDWLVKTIDAKYAALGGSSIVESATIYRTDGTQSFVPTNKFNAASLQANEVATVPSSANIGGKNVVSLESDGNACSNFVLTDGVPFAYSGEKFTAATAVYERSITSDWGVVCLPYKVVVEENPDFEFFVFDAVSGNNVTLKAAEKTGAWKQLIFHKKNASASKLVVRGTEVTVKPIADNVDTNPLEGWTAIGVTRTTTIPLSGAVHNYYISGDKLVKADKVFTLPAFHAYFTLDKSLVPNAPATLSLSDGESGGEEETGTLSSLVNAIEKMKTENVTKSDIEAIVNKLLGK